MLKCLGLGLLLVACSSPIGVAGSGDSGEGGDGPAAASGASAGHAGGAHTSAGGVSEGEGGEPTSAAGAAAAAAAAGGDRASDGGASEAGGSAGSGSAPPTSGQGGTAPACKPKTWYADADHDGFGNAKQSAKACDVPSGYVADSTDCYDSNAKAHPGQIDWFPTERGDGSFDYDCSGAEDLRYPGFSQCPELDNSCPPPNHWPDGFTCDYAGMVAPYSQAEDGWRLYQYSVCAPEPCKTYVVKLPGCGETGHYGKPPLAWNTAKSEYTCEAMPGLSDYDIGRLPKRTQTCH